MTLLRRLAARLRAPFFRAATLARNGPTRGALRRLSGRVPRLETLEDRLPPGDLLGAALTMSGFPTVGRPLATRDGQATEVRRSTDLALDFSASPSDFAAWLVHAEDARGDSTALDARPLDVSFPGDSALLAGGELPDWLAWADSLTPRPTEVVSTGFSTVNPFNPTDAPSALGAGSGQPALALEQTGSYSGTTTVSNRDSGAEAALALFASQPSVTIRSPLPAANNQSLVVQPNPTSPAADGTASPTPLVFQIQAGQEAALGQFRAVAQAHGVTLTPTSLANVYQLDGAGTDLTAMRAYLASQPAVGLVEPLQIVHATDTNPNDPRYASGSLYGMNGTWGIRGPQAWDTTTGSPATVIADIDSGIDYTHEDLYENVWINQAEIPLSRLRNLTDVDGDGVIDFYDLNNPINQGPGKITDLTGHGHVDASDVLAPMVLDASGNDTGMGGWAFPGNTRDGDTAHPNDFIGWNFVANNNNPLDDNNHGSHTAGTIGAIGNNATGVTGVNWKASIMPLKFLAANGTGTNVNAAAAINYSVRHGARASNNSWGGGGFDNLLFNAISAAGTTDFGGGRIGQVFVAAAGNNGRDNDATPFYPANYNLANVLPVAAIGSNGVLASFSNYGATTVQVAAAGVNVVSTVPNNGYGSMSGTSMATPHVTGTVGLMLTQDPGLSATQIINRIVNSVTPDANLAGRISSGGTVNAADALEPAVKGETPAPGATNVPVNTTVQAVFTKSVTAGSISFALQDAAGNPVAATLAYDDSTHTATLTPNAALAVSATYTATVGGAQDQFGVGMTAPVTWSFRTVGTVPTVIAQAPADGSTNVPTTAAVTATFNESVVASSVTFTLQDPSGTPVPASFGYNDGTHAATLTPAAALATSTTYTATVSGARDAAGNVMPNPVSWSFTTEDAPAVIGETPAPDATNVPTSATVTATFSKAVVGASIVFGLQDADGNAVPATLTYGGGSQTATLTPTAVLSNNVTYTATVSAANDASGNPLAAPVSWSFTTSA